MKTLLFCALALSSLVIRVIRWLAWIQQKEYRLDRILLFLQSEEGQKELLRFFPTKSDFAWKTLKRPKITVRILLVCVAFAVLLLAYSAGTYLVMVAAAELWKQFFVVLLSAFVLLGLVPFFVLLSILPSALFTYLYIRVTALRARGLLTKHQPVVIGITGSFGKTSTKQLLRYLLGGEETTFATPSSHNTLYSVCKSVLDGYTGQKYVILEYGAYAPGEIEALTKYCKPTLAVITGFAPQHLGLFGSEEAIIEAKAELVAALEPQSLVFYNGNYKKAAAIAQRGAQKNNATLQSITPDLFFELVSLDVHAQLCVTVGKKKVATKLVGIQYAEICSLAFAVATHLGIETEILVKRLAEFQPTDKFISQRTLQCGAYVIDDGGTSNPQGFESALEILSTFKHSPKIVITPGIVDLGEKSDAIHQHIGEKAKGVVDTVIYVGEVGKEAFSAGFGGEVILDVAGAKAVLHDLPGTATVLIEGRMPPWVRSELKEL